MARRGMTGQLNMFDFFSSMKDTPMGEVEMVSLMPDFEEEPEAVEEPEVVEEPEIVEAPKAVEALEVVEEPKLMEEKAVMSRVYEISGKRIEIAYHNYNKVRISREGEEAEWKVFESSKEAVDYYVQQMQIYEEEK